MVFLCLYGHLTLLFALLYISLKVWSGLVNEVFTDADKFEIEFPEGTDAETRANLLGALFLINMIFFESAKNNNN